MTRHRLALLLAALAACAVPALIGAKPARGTQYAFLVGCGNYRKNEFRALPFTGNDVLRFRDALLQTGFEPAGVLVLHDGASSPAFLPERAKILEALDLLLDGMQPADTLVVALSGHGVQFKGDPVSYFVPTDGRLSDKKTLIALDGKGGLFDKLRACRAKKKLLVVNACRNDPTASLDFATTKAELVDEDREEVPEGIAAIYSCSAGQKSYYDDTRKIALFYDHLAKAWQGAYGSGGPLTLEDVFRQVTVKTKLDALHTLGEKQTPSVRREYKGDWVIAINPKLKAPTARVKVAPDSGPVAEMKFMPVRQGSFWMGWDSQRRQSKLAMVPHDFEMAAYCVTQAQWQEVMGNNPSHHSRQGKGKDAVAKIPDAELARFPVENVSWDEVREFLRKLNAREAGKGWRYRLPTEVEWEYACRNAAMSKEECSYDFYFQLGTGDLSAKEANIDGDRPAGKGVKGPKLGRPTKVGSYAPNKLGLYDMHGNVWQWCEDVFDGKHERNVRGNCFAADGAGCRAGLRGTRARTYRDTNLGFRLVRVALPPVDVVADMKFVRVPKGTFWMGGGTYRDDKDKQFKRRPPEKQVTIAQDFEMAAFHVTRGQWEAVMGPDRGWFAREGGGKDALTDVPEADLQRFPIEAISWYDAQEFVRKLNVREAGKGYVYRLPTEAEWEYACRNAAQSKEECSFDFYFAGGTNDLSSSQANFNGEQPAGQGAKGPNLGRPTMVGSYPPNKLGLYDMQGNVCQWCEDLFDPRDTRRVVRGASWTEGGQTCGAASRMAVAPGNLWGIIGFRLVRVPAPKVGEALAAEMKFVPVPRGTFWVGGGSGVAPRKQVTIAQDFEMAAYCVTQTQFQAVMGYNPSGFARQGGHKDAVANVSDADLARFPVDFATWEEAQAFVKILNLQLRGKGYVYRLPTEAEWEYACRNAATTKAECSFDFYFAGGTNDLSATQANFVGEAPAGKGAKGPNLKRTTKVGSYAPNKLGLYDMHGNVWQFCADAFDDTGDRVGRGGSYYNQAQFCRAGNRARFIATSRWFDAGFRLVRVPAPPVADPLLAEMPFVHLPAGTFWSGGGAGTPPQRQVAIDHDFEMAAFCVTQGQWRALMGNTPSHFSRQGNGKDAVAKIPDAELARFPVEGVSWDDIQQFLRKLNERARGKGWTYRLPTEAEWEYACRGGATTKQECSFDFYLDKPTNDLSAGQANFNGEAPAGVGAKGPKLGRTSKVGSYPPNPLGLFDMHGNVWQYCDRPGVTDPKAGRPIRGGSWIRPARDCRAAVGPMDNNPLGRFFDVGFRLVRVATTRPDTGMAAAMHFVPIPRGTSWLGGGSYYDEKDKQWKRRPGQTPVVIAHDFEMAAYCVTQAQWQEVMGDNPAGFSRHGFTRDRVGDVPDADLARFPVEHVSWNRVQEFLRRLNAREASTGWTYRLPTEAEWEYACRNAAHDRDECGFDFYFEKGSFDISSTQANFLGHFPWGKGEVGPTLQRPAKVGSYAPNRLGLYDMHGNVFQMCADLFEPGNPDRAARGGCLFNGGQWVRASHRLRSPPDDVRNGIGFRLVRVPTPPADAGAVAAMDFVPVPHGTFWAGGGSYLDDKDKQWKTRPPQRQVTIAHDFQMAALCVTQAQWQEVMGTSPSPFTRQGAGKDAVAKLADADLARLPVVSLTWGEVEEFLRRLNAREAGKGWVYRLPTEAEWEYACRGAAADKNASGFDFYFAGPTNDLASTQANFDGNFPAGKAAKGPNLGRPAPVGSYAPNRLGLYDMHGNVWQWCADPFDAAGPDRTIRGGSWADRLGLNLRAASRLRHAPAFRSNNVGLRLVRVPAGMP